MGELRCVVVCETATCKVNIPFVCQFRYQLLHFQSRFLLMCLGIAVEVDSTVWALAPMWETWMRLLALV